MEILLFIILAVVGFILWNIFAFVRYKGRESKDKDRITGYLRSILSLTEAIQKVFSELNDSLPNRLKTETISTVAEKIASLQNQMEMENVIEIYSTFVYRYICRNSNRPHPNVNDRNVLYAVNNMTFEQRNGYFVLKPDSDEEIDKKYPSLVPPQFASGRRLVLAIIVASLTLDVLVIVTFNFVRGAELLPQQIVRFLLTVVLYVFLYRGANWARWAAGILFSLSGFGALQEWFALVSISMAGLLLIAMGLVYVASTVILLFVPSVRAYFSPGSSPLGLN